MTDSLDTRAVRRLALAKAGLLKPEWTGLPRRAGRGERARRESAHAVVGRFGYLQLDTVSVAGARSHALVLLSRLSNFPPPLAEELLVPGAPLFEYWGHEACWIPIDLYPVFGFRRAGLRRSDWWKRMVDGRHALARDILRRIRDEGPLRSADLEGKDGGGWWAHKPAKRVAVALWSSGELAVRERVNFQRTFDLPERVIPAPLRERTVPRKDAVRELVRRALEGHGWAAPGTLAATWRFRNMAREIRRALEELGEAGLARPCTFRAETGRRIAGWIPSPDLELAERLRSVRPRRDRGVLLSPFDPVLWDRRRVSLLFDFDQILEIFKPGSERRYGYFCLPVLAGESLVARVDLKADRGTGRLRVLSRRFESTGSARPGSAEEGRAVEGALLDYAERLGLALGPGGEGKS